MSKAKKAKWKCLFQAQFSKISAQKRIYLKYVNFLVHMTGIMVMW